MPEIPESNFTALARSVGIEVDPERLPTLAADYVAALAMIADLHTVETSLVPSSPFDPAWPDAPEDDQP